MPSKDLRGMTKPGLKRLAQRAGVQRLSGLMYEEFRVYLFEFMEKQLKEIMERLNGRRTVQPEDIPKPISKHSLHFERAPFERLIREAALNVQKDDKPHMVRFNREALKKFQHFCEDHLVHLLKLAEVETSRAKPKRITMFPKDFLKVLYELKLGKYSPDYDE